MQLNNEGVQKSIFAALKEDPNFAKFLEHAPVNQLPLVLRIMSSPVYVHLLLQSNADNL